MAILNGTINYFYGHSIAILTSPEGFQLENLIEQIPSGKRLHNYGKSPFSMGNSTISMVMASIAILTNYQAG